jgi:acryloyl-coenzyme A reductase
VKAVRLGPGNRGLELAEVPDPRPQANTVLIRPVYTGVCYRDLLTADGHFPRARPGVILGHEIAGVVEEVGPGVMGFSPGDRVASLIYVPCLSCDRCLSGQENLCRNKRTYGEDIDGSYAELIRAHVNGLVRVPAKVSWEAATIAACVTGMLIHALKARAALKRGERVLVTGAGGGVGIHAVQLAKAYGASVIAATSSPWKEQAIRKAGADEVIVAPDGKFAEKVKEATKGEGVDIVIEAVGKPTLEESLRSLKWGGRLVQVGNVQPEPAPLPLGLVILRENALLGSLSCTRRELQAALGLSARGKVVPVVHGVLALAEAERAHRLLRNREAVGRVLLKP